MKKSTFTFGIIIVTLLVTSFATLLALADTQSDPATIIQGSNSMCGGAYHAFAKLTNSAGSVWITPSNNASSGTFTDASGFAPPYSSVVLVTRFSDKVTWCGTNSLTFPATNSNKYQMTAYVTSTLPPPTNGQKLTLQIQWQ